MPLSRRIVSRSAGYVMIHELADPFNSFIRFPFLKGKSLLCYSESAAGRFTKNKTYTMIPRIQLLIILWLPAALQTRAQSSYRERLQVLHEQMATAYLHHDVAALLRIYSIDAVSMTDYHPALFGKKAIAVYLGGWMDSAKVNAYSRQTYDIT